ncbi:hypothetical protein Tco_0733146, partial [Tanacetum coccineum]
DDGGGCWWWHGVEGDYGGEMKTMKMVTRSGGWPEIGRRGGLEMVRMHGSCYCRRR